MNITRLNFTQHLPFIRNSINKARFIGMDLEMSGIISVPSSTPSLTDTMQLRYEKTVERIQKYIPLQLGLCCVEIEQRLVRYYPFNIYIYPLTLRDSTQAFSFNTDSMSFLADNKFDFNKLFYEGVRYISNQALMEDEKRGQASEWRAALKKVEMMESPQVKAFYNLWLSAIREWIPSENNQLMINIQFIRVRVYTALVDKVTQMFPSFAFTITYLGKNQQIIEDNDVIKRCFLKLEKKQALQEVQPSMNMSNPKQQLLNTVMNAISESQKPILLHNGYLDLMHIYYRLFGGLPAMEQEYKRKVSSIFPRIYDTKYLCNNHPVLNNTLNRLTNLDNCYQSLRQEDIEGEFVIDDRCRYQFDDTQQHEAGFDALMTADVFMRGVRMLGKKHQTMRSEEFFNTMKYYENKIPMGNIRIPFQFSAGGEGAAQIEKNTAEKYHFSIILDEDFNSSAIQDHLMRRYGSLHIYWQNQLSFILTLLDPEMEKKFTRELLDQCGVGICNKYDTQIKQTKIGCSLKEFDQVNVHGEFYL